MCKVCQEFCSEHPPISNKKHFYGTPKLIKAVQHRTYLFKWVLLILQKNWLVRVGYRTPTEMYAKCVHILNWICQSLIIRPWKGPLSFTSFVYLKNRLCPTIKAHILHHLFWLWVCTVRVGLCHVEVCCRPLSTCLNRMCYKRKQVAV